MKKDGDPVKIEFGEGGKNKIRIEKERGSRNLHPGGKPRFRKDGELIAAAEKRCGLEEEITLNLNKKKRRRREHGRILVGGWGRKTL